MIYFTADTHFGHTNIIKYCKRPFKNISEMDAELIKRWNMSVGPFDHVYHLGDFCWGKSPESVNFYLTQLNGIIHFIDGNHDKRFVIDVFKHSRKHRYEGQRCELRHLDDFPLIVLEHYPLAIWNKSHYGSWHLFGHQHGTFEHVGALAFDIGVDCFDYAPISIFDVQDKMEHIKTVNPNWTKYLPVV